MNIADAIIYKDLATVRKALAANEHIDFIDQYGYTPLIETCIVDDIKKFQLVVDKKGADVNKPDLTGQTALHWAVENQNLELCQLLLEKGANPNAYSAHSQPVLVKALLRENKELKQLLVQHGASLQFAWDFINTKLLGHMFELVGRVDIVDTKDYFIEVDFEGFFLESTVELIRYSLADFKNNFAARHLRPMFHDLQTVIDALSVTSELTKYQQYLIKVEEHRKTINKLLINDPLIIPVTQEGHALTMIRCSSFLAVCDRAEDNKVVRDKVPIYYLNRPSRLTADLICELVYKKQPIHVFHKILPAELGMQQIDEINVPPQRTGNCTWANVEAGIPALLSMLLRSEPQKDPEKYKISDDPAMNVYQEWREWGLERSLYLCIKSFHEANPARKASKASILGAILFQCCSFDNEKQRERAMKIIPILKTKGYEYILKSYIDTYVHRHPSAEGNNLQKLLDYYEHYHF